MIKTDTARQYFILVIMFFLFTACSLEGANRSAQNAAVVEDSSGSAIFKLVARKVSSELPPELFDLEKDLKAELDRMYAERSTMTEDEWSQFCESKLEPFAELAHKDPEFSDNKFMVYEANYLNDTFRAASSAFIKGDLPLYLQKSAELNHNLGQEMTFEHDLSRIERAIIFDLHDDPGSGIYRSSEVLDRYNELLINDRDAAVNLFKQETNFKLIEVLASNEDPTRVEVKFEYLKGHKNEPYVVQEFTDVLEMEKGDDPWELSYHSNN